MAFGGFSNIIGTVFYNRAMQKGSATAVTGLSACYPAVTLLLAMGLIGCVTTALRSPSERPRHCDVPYPEEFSQF